MRIIRGIAVLSIATLGFLGLTACSGTDTPVAKTKSSAADSLSDELSTENFIKTVSQATLDQGSMSMETVIDVEGEKVSMFSDVVFTEDSQNLKVKVDSGGTSFEMRVVDKLVYVNYGEISGNKFLKIDPADPEDPLASQFEGVLDDLDPMSSLTDLDGAVRSVKADGKPEIVDGAECQPYSVVVDTSMISGSKKDVLDESGESLPETITYKYWIDDDNLMRKVFTSAAGAKTEMLFSNWGGEMNIVAPTADEIGESPQP